MGLLVLELTPSTTVVGLFRLDLLRDSQHDKDDNNNQNYNNKNSTNSSSNSNGHSNHNHNSTSLTVNSVPPPADLQRPLLLLHTSGTSGNKKLVAYSAEMLFTGVACIVTAWSLCPEDTCLNMMPLFHIGGIVRNILAPLLAGGAVVCCGGFGPCLFWDVLAAQPISWYYAAPTMHQAILYEASRRMGDGTGISIQGDGMRFIANAAGALSPSLASALQVRFRCLILTSYGMTECMPISTPPPSYALDPHGTSGIPTGPQVNNNYT